MVDLYDAAHSPKAKEIDKLNRSTSSDGHRNIPAELQQIERT